MLRNRAYIIALDTLMQNRVAKPGAKEFLQALQKENIFYRIVTTRSSITIEDLLKQLSDCGLVGIKKENLYTTTMAAIDYLFKHDKNLRDVDYIGGSGLRRILVDANLHITHIRPRYIFMGMDSSLSYDEYQEVFTQVKQGSILVSVDDRRIQKYEDIDKIGNGSIVHMLEYATKKKALHFGVGSKVFLKQVCATLPYSYDETIMVGNSFKKDILPALQYGMLTFYVAGSEDMMSQGISDDVHPDYILDDLSGLLR